MLQEISSTDKHKYQSFDVGTRPVAPFSVHSLPRIFSRFFLPEVLSVPISRFPNGL